MPSVSLYIDEELYLPLKTEAQRRGREFHRFIMDVLREASNEARSKQSQGSPPVGWAVINP